MAMASLNKIVLGDLITHIALHWLEYPYVERAPVKEGLSDFLHRRELEAVSKETEVWRGLDVSKQARSDSGLGFRKTAVGWHSGKSTGNRREMQRPGVRETSGHSGAGGDKMKTEPAGC